jgi:DNA-directed RNA polymerase specialized sigma24 family protein
MHSPDSSTGGTSNHPQHILDRNDPTKKPAISVLRALEEEYIRRLTEYARDCRPELSLERARALVENAIVMSGSAAITARNDSVPTRTAVRAIGAGPLGYAYQAFRTGDNAGGSENERSGDRSSGADPQLPAGLGFEDSVVRHITADLVWQSSGKSLEHYAAGCLASQSRVTCVGPDDLVQNSILLLLAGRIRWRGSSARLVRSLKATIRYLSRDACKYERNLTSFDDQLHAIPGESFKAWRLANRAILRRDITQAVDGLPEATRDAVVCCLVDGSRATEVAADRGIAASTVRVLVHRGRARLRAELAAHAP